MISNTEHSPVFHDADLGERLAKKGYVRYVGLPEPEYALPPVYPNGLTKFSQHTYETNLTAFTDLCGRISPETLPQFLFQMWPWGSVKSGEEAQAIIEKIKKSEPVEKTLAKFLPMAATEINDPIGDFLKSVEKQTLSSLLMSNTHAADYELFRMLIGQNRELLNRIGMVVFDHHIDCMGGFSFYGVQKNNFLRALVDSGLGAVSIFGIHPDSNKTGSRGMDSAYDYASKQQRISLPTGYMDEHGKVSLALVKNAVTQELKRMRELGMDNLFISVDLDCLDMLAPLITATPYSPFAVVTQMGIWNGAQHYRHGAVTLDDIKYNKQVFLNAIDNNMPDGSVDFASGYIGVPRVPEGGFSLPDLLDSIKQAQLSAAACGMKVGIPLGNGRVMGSVTELSGHDYGGNTARASIQIATELLH